MTALARWLILSHTTVFIAGVVVGKSMDADELELYRSMHESTWTKTRRVLERVGIGVVAVGGTLMVLRLVSRSRQE